MDKSLTYLNKEVEELRGTVEDKDKQIEYLHTQHLYLESYSRRENLKFFGIPENEASASEGKQQKERLRNISRRYAPRLRSG